MAGSCLFVLCPPTAKNKAVPGCSSHLHWSRGMEPGRWGQTLTLDLDRPMTASSLVLQR